MANVPISNMTATWIDSGTTYNAIKMNVTDTASNAASKLLDLGTGGGSFVSRFSVGKTGGLTFNLASPSGADPQIRLSATQTIYTVGSNTWIGSSSGTGNVGTIDSTFYIGGSSDVQLNRDAANTLALRNATNAQTFNIYNTYTTTTNYERGFLKWNTNVLQIGTEKGSGGGTARALEFQTDGTTRLTIDATGGVSYSAVQVSFNSQVNLVNNRGYASSGLINSANLLIASNSAKSLELFSDATSGRGIIIATSTGIVQFAGTTSSFPSLKRETNTLRVRLADDSGDAQLIAHRLTAAGGILENSTTFYTDNSGVRTSQTGYFSFASSGLTGGAPDVYLYRDAANTLAQRNATNAQTFRVYNTYTDASNYERGVITWSSNVLRIATENAGTGSSRTIQLYPSSGNVDVIDGSSVAQISFNIQSSNGLRVASDRPIGFTPGGANLAAPDTTLRRVAAGILGVRGGLITDAGALSFIEQTAPAAPAANGVYIYAEDNGAGKTRLMALFNTGAAQQIAIEP